MTVLSLGCRGHHYAEQPARLRRPDALRQP